MKPLIGINLDLQDGLPYKYSIRFDYVDAIQQAGGVPILLPHLQGDDLSALLKKLQGILLIGGDDYSPALYGEKPHHTLEPIHPLREKFDLELAKQVLYSKKMPVLGICGGSQLMNIVLGGSLIQDIPSNVPGSKITHSSSGKNNTHLVYLEDESKLAEIYNQTTLHVPTSHHQSVKKLGIGIKAAAHAEDGIIEAIELTEHSFAIGVQWHPERDYDNNQVLFAELIKHAQNHA